MAFPLSLTVHFEYNQMNMVTFYAFQRLSKDLYKKKLYVPQQMSSLGENCSEFNH